MEQAVTRAQLADLFGVSEATIVLWEAQSMPTVPAGDPPLRRPEGKGWRVTRAEVAKFLDLHPDSVSRLVATGGLDVAVIRSGGHSKPMVFDMRTVVRWELARKHPQALAAIAKDDLTARTFVGKLLESLPLDTQRVTRPTTTPAPPRRAQRRTER